MQYIYHFIKHDSCHSNPKFVFYVNFLHSPKTIFLVISNKNLNEDVRQPSIGDFHKSLENQYCSKQIPLIVVLASIRALPFCASLEVSLLVVLFWGPILIISSDTGIHVVGHPFTCYSNRHALTGDSNRHPLVT